MLTRETPLRSENSFFQGQKIAFEGESTELEPLAELRLAGVNIPAGLNHCGIVLADRGHIGVIRTEATHVEMDGFAVERVGLFPAALLGTEDCKMVESGGEKT
jgi:hypothetical protein